VSSCVVVVASFGRSVGVAQQSSRPRSHCLYDFAVILVLGQDGSQDGVSSGRKVVMILFLLTPC
jgi:hypothetical protein